MSFFLEESVTPNLAFDYRALAKRVVGACLAAEHFPCGAEVTLTLTDDAGIREYNKSYRGIDRVTDVLSFPLLEYEAPADFSFLSEDNPSYFDPDTGEVLLGDIVLSAERVLAQAGEYGHSPEREYAFLITHSMLHLFGYDHENVDDARLMEARQREILNAMNILR